MNEKIIAAESVTIGHPDKVADYISDSLVTEYLKADPASHVAIETLVTTNRVIIAGEIKSTAKLNHKKIIKQAILEIGYITLKKGFDYKTCKISDYTHTQSGDIDMGVSKEAALQGAGDQGFMFGYATNETKDFMPLPIYLAKQLTNQLTETAKSTHYKVLLPDGKSQVVVDYSTSTPTIKNIVVSNQHNDIDIEEVREYIKNKIIKPVLEENGFSMDSIEKIYINPTGRFVIGGPEGDTGLTGRKIVIDQYGPSCEVGGGAFSGKDPSKVDRSGAYMARYIAKNIVASGLAEKCKVQISYAIGVADPTSVCIDTLGTGKIPDGEITEKILKLVDLKPYAIEQKLNLRKTNYKEVMLHGTFGNNYCPWEQLDLVEKLKA